MSYYERYWFKRSRYTTWAYKKNDKTKIVVACKDFTSNGTVFKQFAEIKNSQIETSKNEYGTELSEVLDTIDNQLIYDVIKLKEFFGICLLLTH